MNVLVICHGNINRSPLAAAIIKRVGKDFFQVKSAGFVNPNRRAAKKMRDAASELDINLEEHRSQLITPELTKWCDILIYMDGGNLRRLNETFNGEMRGINVSSLGTWADESVERIKDPAFMRRGSPEFHDVVNLIAQSATNFAEKVIASADPFGT